MRVIFFALASVGLIWISRRSLFKFRSHGFFRFWAWEAIRHPMYSSLLFLAWGVFLKKPAWPGGALALAASVSLVLTAKAEEAEDIRYFGEAYRDYMRQTKRFIPFMY